jgi:hypothetical protein
VLSLAGLFSFSTIHFSTVSSLSLMEMGGKLNGGKMSFDHFFLGQFAAGYANHVPFISRVYVVCDLKPQKAVSTFTTSFLLYNKTK